MPDINTLAPITILAAVILFFIKEGIELIRRILANQRKIHALKVLSARECERNLWTIKVLRATLISVAPKQENKKKTHIQIENHIGRHPRAKVISDDGSHESRVIPDVHKELIFKYLLDAATLDKNFFYKLESAYDALAELEHIRESLVNIHETEKELNQESMIDSFYEYGLHEIKNTEKALASLYTHCTGKKNKLGQRTIVSNIRECCSLSRITFYI